METETKVIALRSAIIGAGLPILRALPTRGLRAVGAWCFVDHLGPVQVVAGEGGIDVGPHPHIGLQTFTWMIAGTIVHKDSLGVNQRVAPKELNLMTAGKGIVHTEETPADETGVLHCAQLWIALPEHKKNMAPEFKHYAHIPLITHEGLAVYVLVGTFLGQVSPVAVHSPLMAADLLAKTAKTVTFALNPQFEYGILVIKGTVTLEETMLDVQHFWYSAVGRTSVTITFAAGAQILLIGGAPFEPIIHWWNFIARTNEEIITAREDWIKGAARFGAVPAYDGPRLRAPELTARLKPS